MPSCISSFSLHNKNPTYINKFVEIREEFFWIAVNLRLFLFSTDEADMDTITSFMQEAIIVKGLKHPNIVELVGVVLQRAAPPYIVTPLTRNGDLGHFLKISRATSARLQVRTRNQGLPMSVLLTSFLCGL